MRPVAVFDTNILLSAIGWKGNYHIEGAAFIFTDRDSGRMVTILGYPTQRLAQLGSEISNMFG